MRHRSFGFPTHTRQIKAAEIALHVKKRAEKIPLNSKTKSEIEREIGKIDSNLQENPTYSSP